MVGSWSASASSSWPPSSDPEAGASLPLLKCCTCGWRQVIRLVSKSERNPGRVFFECPNHKRGSHGSCDCYHCIDEYLDLVLCHGYNIAEEEGDDKDSFIDIRASFIDKDSRAESVVKKISNIPGNQMSQIAEDIKLQLDLVVGIGWKILLVCTMILAVNLYVVVIM
uniref:GRF-type domain-containing protein n=1 Tax=Aegilops tauschii TaxID=37682 RepID=M8BVR5_AEGTA